jgi:hypothetical protein
LIRRFVPSPDYVIADNSHDDDAAEAVEQAAIREQRPYLRLPPNPWAGPSASRSHGLALNWLWRNLIRPSAPNAFGVHDHDIFPTEPDDPFEPLERQDVYGDIRKAGGRWFLWAGFCFYRFAAVRQLPLDFGQDWFVGLDTGGANWWPLYRHIDRQTIELRKFTLEAVFPGVSTEDSAITRHGKWLHEYGTGHNPQHAVAKRLYFAERLAPLLEPDGS